MDINNNIDINNNRLSSEDMISILNKFPHIELSYDKILHRKVFINYLSSKNIEYDNDDNEDNVLLTIIPKGKKYIIWFTYLKDRNVCFLIELDKNKNIVSIDEITYCFDNKLSYNTILYGTFLTKINNDINKKLFNN